MAFLDNSGDILLDAVLTDTGRMRMARGDFKIVKFALGDDEINYGLFEANHPSGSAYQDLKILQTPVFEAFTNNTSVMKSKLMTIGRTNILYLPKLLLNTTATSSPMVQGESATTGNNDTFVLIANRKLAEFQAGSKNMKISSGVQERVGYMYGHGGEGFPSRSIIVDQGIVDANEDQDVTAAIDPDLRETQFILKVDHRILRVTRPRLSPDNSQLVTSTEPGNNNAESPVFIDDDQIAHYAFGSADTSYVAQLTRPNADNQDTVATELVHQGPLGNRFGFRLMASNAAKTSNSLYSKLGTLGARAGGTGGATIKDHDGAETIADCDFIDTIVRVTGVTTGYSMDIPIRVVRNLDPN
mgnify:CR=1 FL=1